MPNSPPNDLSNDQPEQAIRTETDPSEESKSNPNSSNSDSTPDASAERGMGMFSKFRARLLNLQETFTRRFSDTIESIRISKFLVIVVSIVLALLLGWMLDKVLTYQLSRSYVDEIAYAFDLDPYRARAITIAVFIVLVVIIRYCFSISSVKRNAAFATLAGLAIIHSLFLSFGTKDSILGKCYVVTRTSIEVRNSVGTDPSTGLPCVGPITADMWERIRKYNEGLRPQLIRQIHDAEIFDSKTGQPVIWYARAKNGQIDLFNLMGFHPRTGASLAPVTTEILSDWQAQQKRAPKWVHVSLETLFFDPITGSPRFWVGKNDAGELDFFDGSGFHPETQNELVVATKDIVDGWKARQKDVAAQRSVRAAKKIRVTLETEFFNPITGAPRFWTAKNDTGENEFFDGPGFHPETQAELIVATKEVVDGWKTSIRERISQRPVRPARKVRVTIDTEFFDPITGSPKYWTAPSDTGQRDFFDGPGFHPETQAELVVATKELVDAWKSQQRDTQTPRKPPKRIEVNANTVIYDSVSGEPQVWFWREEREAIEFFDGPGFHPQSGEKLLPITKETKPIIEEHIKKLRDEIEKEKKAQDERKLRDAAEEAARKRREADDARERQEQAKRRSEAGRLCDQLAANPNDMRRVSEGIPFEVLKTQAGEAVKQCSIAVEQNPNETRYRYQLARALQHVDRPRAAGILDELVRRGYPAACDNLAWIFLFDRKDPVRAVALFRRGVQLEDPDSMVGLAEMIDRGHTTPRDASETKIELYRRAASLGHLQGRRAYEREIEKEEVTQQSRAQQLEQQRIMMQMLGTVIQNMPRR
jgi:hypothetical protein